MGLIGQRGARAISAMASAIAAVALLGASAALAAAPDELLQVPPDGEEGVAAGRLFNPRDMVAEARTGHVFVSELNNSRISEFTAWGQFVKAWGWDVAPGPVDEEQEVRVRASEGQFVLSFGGDSTAGLPFDASAAQVETALEALPSIAAGGGGVAVGGGTGTTLRVYVVRFDQGALEGTDVEEILASDGATPLGGGSPASEATVATRANGTAGGAGLEACTTASGCQEGNAGSGAGQFNWPTGVTLDEAGNVYVFEVQNRRMQKFSPAGEFLWMAGGEVNQGGGTPANPGNLCTAQHLDNGDTCGAGAAGIDPGYLPNTIGNYIADSEAADAILVGDVGRIQEFNEDGTFKGAITLTGSLAGKTIRALATDSTGAIYLGLSATEGVFKLSAGGVLAGAPYPLSVREPVALETDSEDNVYAVEGKTNDSLIPPKEVRGFDSSGAPLEGMKAGDKFAMVLGDSPNGLGANLCAGSEPPGNLYVVYGGFGGGSYFKGYGTPPIGCEPPPPAAPEIKDQYSTKASIDGASVRAEINPHFWPDVTYLVQYGSEQCVTVGGWEAACVASAPSTPALLTEKSTDAVVRSAKVFLGGLQPDTAYRFRFVAQSGGGGPVRGVGGTESVDGAEGKFRTFREPTSILPCANDRFRQGPSARLPDCRAYEMVSPLEKGNGDALAPNATNAGGASGLHQATTSGEGLTYTTATPFGDPEGAPVSAQYIARRGVNGWSSEAIMPPRTRVPFSGGTAKLNDEFKIFSPDLCAAWLRSTYDPPLTEDAVPGYFNLYRRENCGAQRGTYEALTTVTPPHAISKSYDALEVQGFAADRRRAIYVANDSIATGAPANPQGRFQLYERTPEGQLRYVCVLPNGAPVDPSEEACYAGTSREFAGESQEGSLENAISADGRRIFWSAGVVEAVGGGLGGGRIYVRIDPDFEVEGDEMTLDVSKAAEEDAGSNRSIYRTAARSGARAIFTTGGGLYSFEVESATTTPIAEEDVIGVLGASENATRVYFASEAAIPGSGQNSEEDEAEVGEPNLYLWTQGEGGPATYAFIGTLSNEDTVGAASAGVPSSLASSPLDHRARVTPDGLHAAFISTAPLTGYDNTDAEKGVPATEVFVYNATEGELRCTSCNPTGARPTGRELLTARRFGSGIQAAAQIPGHERSLHASRLLSDDGRRLFFESYEALVPGDTNNRQDVYQWEEAGKGTCRAADSTFVPSAGGCVDLISSGESPRDSELLESTPTGNDVFFSTLSSLIPPDYGLVDIYDARVEGGFEYPEPDPPCEGEACQAPPPPPPVITPSSSTYVGPGDRAASTGKKQRRCAKGKRRAGGAKARCVKKSKGAKRSGRGRR